MDTGETAGRPDCEEEHGVEGRTAGDARGDEPATTRGLGASLAADPGRLLETGDGRGEVGGRDD